mgnify:CR=1 FL=1
MDDGYAMAELPSVRGAAPILQGFFQVLYGDDNSNSTVMGVSAEAFAVLGIQQIAIGGPDKKRLQTLWVDMLGLVETGTYRSERENVDEDICAMGVGPFKVEVDLMQPLDPDKKPAVHTTPLNHIGLWIDGAQRDSVRAALRRHPRLGLCRGLRAVKTLGQSAGNPASLSRLSSFKEVHHVGSGLPRRAGRGRKQPLAGVAHGIGRREHPLPFGGCRSDVIGDLCWRHPAFGNAAGDL